MRYCLTCDNPVYDNRKKYCSKRCKRIMKKHRRLNELYYDDETNAWERLS